MEGLLKVPVASRARIRILQITDTHLFAGEQETLLGVNTYRSYHVVLAAIQAQGKDVDLIVATGDLVQDPSQEAYHHFALGIAQLPAPSVWLPGNHDFQPAMVDVLAQAGIAPEKHVLLGDAWQIILLDSQVLGMPHGKLSEYQLKWLERTLVDFSDRHTILLLHHHPLASGCTWLDQHSLRNSYHLDVVLVRYPQVKNMLCGHIHQELDLDWNGRRLMATPSTSVQFKPHSTNFTIDDVGPGWRYLDLLSDGTLESRIYRLNGREFLPNMDSYGY
ncbi:MAG: 3',5'-cyclic-AMP phosphodiesterase [Candidatus Malihini olakiniferum]